MNAAENYLRRYPTGPHRHEVAAYLVADTLNEWKKKLYARRDFHEFIAELTQTNILLERFAKDAVSIEGLVDGVNLQKQVQHAVEALVIFRDVDVKTIKKGDVVMYVQLMDSNWNSSYIHDRINNLPLGSILTVDSVINNGKDINVNLPAPSEGKKY